MDVDRVRRGLLYGVAAPLMVSEGIYDLVFVNMAYNVTGQASSAASTYAVGYIAEILVTIVGAGFLDHFDKRRVFFLALIAKMCLFGGVVGVSSLGSPSLHTIWFFAFSIDLVHHYSRLALFTLIIALFRKDELTRVEGTNAVLAGLTRIGAPLLGAAAIAALGASRALLVSVGAQVLAAALAAALFRIAEYRPTASESAPGTFWEQARAASLGTLHAARDILRDPQWRVFLGLYCIINLVIAVSVLLWIPLLRNFHGLDEASTGWFLSLGALGMMAAGLFVRSLDAVSNRVVVLSLLGYGVGLCFAVLSPGSLAAMAAATLFVNVGMTVFYGSITAALQAAMPEDRAGSWFGAVDFGTRIFAMIGIVCGGWLFDTVGPTLVFASMAVALVVCTNLWALQGSPVTQDQASAGSSG